MAAALDHSELLKTSYRPIEAAIRWSGAADQERIILRVLKGRVAPNPDEFPQWPQLHLHVERIHDAILNKDLPYGLRGVTVRRHVSLEHPDLTVRHVDLKSWMTRCYPGERPDFLFNETEKRLARAFVTEETLRALLDEREAMKLQIEQLQSKLQMPARNILTLHKEDETSITRRAETTYLHVIGGLRDLLLGASPSGEPYSKFKTQDAVISALVAHHGGRLGMTERTIAGKFAAATKLIRG